MIPPVKSITIGGAWLGSLALAFWLGSGRDGAASAGPGPDQPGNATVHGMGSAAGFVGDPNSGAGGDRLSGRPQRRGALGALMDYAERGRDENMPRSLRELAAAMDLDQVKQAVASLEELDSSPSQVGALKAVLGRWAQLAPMEAIGYAGDMEAPKRRHDAKLWVLRAWGGSDPAGALAYIKEHPDSSIDRYAKSTIFSGLGEGDLHVAMNFLESINEKDTPYGTATYSAVREMFLKNDRAVVEWASSLSAGEVRDRAIHGLIDQWARYDPLAAKAWMESNAAPNNLVEAQVELGESWARVDPQAALAWSASLTEDAKTAERVRQRIFNRWLQYDYQAAAEYLAVQEPSPELDSAFELYIGKARNYDPASTMIWAESITNPKRRIRAMQQVAASWKGRDRGSFETYLQEAGLTETEFKKLK